MLLEKSDIISETINLSIPLDWKPSHAENTNRVLILVDGSVCWFFCRSLVTYLYQWNPLDKGLTYGRETASPDNTPLDDDGDRSHALSLYSCRVTPFFPEIVCLF